MWLIECITLSCFLGLKINFTPPEDATSDLQQNQKIIRNDTSRWYQNTRVITVGDNKEQNKEQNTHTLKKLIKNIADFNREEIIASV